MTRRRLQNESGGFLLTTARDPRQCRPAIKILPTRASANSIKARNYRTSMRDAVGAITYIWGDYAPCRRWPCAGGVV